MNGNDLESQAIALAHLQLALQRLFNRRVTASGASFARARLLILLNKTGPMRAVDIADYLNQTPRTVTEAIDGLEKQGWVTRRLDPDDRRVKHVELTDAGRAAALAVEPLRQELIKTVFGQLSAEEGAQLLKITAKLQATVDEEAARTP